MAEYLLHDKATSNKDFTEEWGIDTTLSHRGGLVPPLQINPIRQIHMFQRTDGKVGKKLGKTTGWIHRENLRKNQVEFHIGVSYDKIDDNGLHYIKNNTPHVLDVDNIIICAGQESHTYLATQLKNQNYHKIHIIGGAFMARELDAKFAIENGMKLGLSL